MVETGPSDSSLSTRMTCFNVWVVQLFKHPLSFWPLRIHIHIPLLLPTIVTYYTQSQDELSLISFMTYHAILKYILTPITFLSLLCHRMFICLKCFVCKSAVENKNKLKRIKKHFRALTDRVFRKNGKTMEQI